MFLYSHQLLLFTIQIAACDPLYEELRFRSETDASNPKRSSYRFRNIHSLQSRDEL